MTKNSKYIKLLENQLSRLEADDFDLEAWKSTSISAISRIFGADDVRNEQIQQLKIDYSSWALRDSNSNYKPVETCKRKGKEILRSAIEEIEVFGLENNKESLLSEYFSTTDVKKLISKETDKGKTLNKLKKEELQQLLLRFIDGTTS